MISAFDKANIDDILAGHGDWFTARLLRYIGASASPLRQLIAKQFPDEVDAVGDKDTTGKAPTWGFLLSKADSGNRSRLEAITA